MSCASLVCGDAHTAGSRTAVPDDGPAGHHSGFAHVHETHARRMSLILALALQLASASPPYSAAEPHQWDRVAKTVTIHRDKFGVPHVYGPTDASVVFGLMYAQAEDNFWQLEEDYLEDLGRRAEVY